MNAYTQSLNAARDAFDKSPLDMYDVAEAVAKEQEQRAAEFAKLNTPEAPAKLKTPALLGCYVNGTLKFQSRDHEAIHEYAERHMNGAKNFGNNVWVAPVGSFITAEQGKKSVAKKLNKVHKGA